MTEPFTCVEPDAEVFALAHGHTAGQQFAGLLQGVQGVGGKRRLAALTRSYKWRAPCSASVQHWPPPRRCARFRSGGTGSWDGPGSPKATGGGHRRGSSLIGSLFSKSFLCGTAETLYSETPTWGTDLARHYTETVIGGILANRYVGHCWHLGLVTPVRVRLSGLRIMLGGPSVPALKARTQPAVAPSPQDDGADDAQARPNGCWAEVLSKRTSKKRRSGRHPRRHPIQVWIPPAARPVGYQAC